MSHRHYEVIAIPNKRYGELEIVFESYTVGDAVVFEMKPRDNEVWNDRYSKFFDDENQFNAYMNRYRDKALRIDRRS